PHRLDVELTLTAKVVVKKTLGDARRVGEPVDRQIFVSVLRKELDAELEQLRSTRVELQPHSAVQRLGFTRRRVGIPASATRACGWHADRATIQPSRAPAKPKR